VFAGRITHVFVLVLENRSFDHLLGLATGTGTDATTGASTSVDGPTDQVNLYGRAVYPVTAGAPFVLPVDPPHEFCDIQLQLASVGLTADGYPAAGSSAHGNLPSSRAAGGIQHQSSSDQARPGTGHASAHLPPTSTPRHPVLAAAIPDPPSRLPALTTRPARPPARTPARVPLGNLIIFGAAAP